jgi:hypothetical protein
MPIARVLGSLLLVISWASAQQPLNTPHYYLSTTPSVAAGEVRVGALSRESGQNFKDASYLTLYLIPTQAGEIVDLLVESNDFAPHLTLLTPQGQVVERNEYANSAGAYYAARIRRTASVTGNHLLVVSGSVQGDVGSFTLTRNRPVVAPPVVHELAFPGGVADRLAAFSSQSIWVTLLELAYVRAELRSSEFDTFLELYGPYGQFIAGNDDAMGTDSRLTLELEAGRYEFIVSGYWEDAEGAYRFDIFAYDPPPQVTRVVPMPGVFEGMLLPEAIDLYLLQLDRPQRVTIELRSQEFDTYLEIFGADGLWIDANDDAIGTDSRLVLSLAAGSYRVEVSGFWSDDEGLYRISFAW